MFNKYYFIVNPAAGHGHKLTCLFDIESFCREQGIHYEIAITKKPNEASELARQAAHDFEVVVAVGGDGTAHEVANGLVGSEAVLGIIPTGSGNDFGRQLGYTKNARHALRILRAGRVRKIDLGRLNGRNYFLNSLGIGFDGEVVKRVGKFTRYLGGFLAYLLAVVRTLATYKFNKVNVQLDDINIDREMLLVAVCNGTTYGGGFQIAPSAKIDDGCLTVCVIDRTGRFYALRNLPKIMRGLHVKLPEVHTYTARRAVIESADQMASQIDGELLPPYNKFIVEIIPRRLKVITA